MDAWLILSLVTAAVLLASAVRRVPAGRVYSVYRHGKLARVLEQGTHLIQPWRDRVRHKIDLGGQMLKLDEPLDERRELRGTVYWQVLEPERVDAVIDEVEQLIRRGAQAAVREQAPAALADRHDAGAHVKQTLNSTLRPRGMMVTRVELEAA